MAEKSRPVQIERCDDQAVSAHLPVVELLNADLRSRGVPTDVTPIAKIVSKLWPAVQESWDYAVGQRLLLRPGNAKATYKRVLAFFENEINTNTVAKVEFHAKEPVRAAVWGELTRLAIHHGHGVPLPKSVEITMLMRVGYWRIEKAKTSKGSCRECGRVIIEGELRFGQDEKNSTWFHLACGATGAPRAFKPFAAKVAELSATTPRPATTPKAAPLPAKAKELLSGGRLDPKSLAVLADWLQSSGDAWGELLALEAAGEKKLANAHLSKHRDSLTGSFGLRPFFWKRGFIDEASLQGNPATLASQVEELATLRTASRLRVLALMGKTDAAVFVAISQKAPASLRELTIEWPGKGIEALSLPKLQALRIRLRNPGDDFLEKASLPGLKRLIIHGKRPSEGDFGTGAVLSPAFLDRLLDSKLISRLQTIEIGHGALDEKGARHVLERKATLSKVKQVVIGAGFWTSPLAKAMETAFKKQLPKE